jgi:cellulose synthase/poly-beta-1,6-N-acetylglucosamine synthase-like glycosyltransferase
MVHGRWGEPAESAPPQVPPALSVIVPAYNAAHTIGRCLEALAQQTLPRDCYEVIVVDDGSADETGVQVREQPGVRLLVQAHAGPAAARNLGVQHAQGELVLFTDADCEPAPDWIEQISAPFGRQSLPAGEGLVAGAKGAYLTRQRALVARFVQIEYEERYERMARLATVDFVDTYSAAYRRDIFVETGGFDTSFPVASVEDQEFSFRLAGQGYRLVFVPQARVYHWGHPGSLGAYWRRKLRIGFWKVKVLRRHPAKLWRDSHTPQSLKAQMALLAGGGVCLVGGCIWPPLAWGAGVAAALFLVTALPFLVMAWSKDHVVALVSPPLLAVRALALGMGMLAGLMGTRSPGRPDRGGDGRAGRSSGS